MLAFTLIFIITFDAVLIPELNTYWHVDMKLFTCRTVIIGMWMCYLIDFPPPTRYGGLRAAHAEVVRLIVRLLRTPHKIWRLRRATVTAPLFRPRTWYENGFGYFVHLRNTQNVVLCRTPFGHSLPHSAATSYALASRTRLLDYF